MTDIEEYVAFTKRIVTALGNRIVKGANPEELVSLLTLERHIRMTMDRTLTDSVQRLRDEWGFSWTDIGNALGISRQGARQRFMRDEAESA